MLKTEPKAKVKEGRENFLKQANARMKDIKAMRGDINRRKKKASKQIQKDLDDWIVNLDMDINLAEVEIEIVENSNEFNWEKHRVRVDEALGKAENDIGKGYEILERPEEIMHRF
jgi:hypothetical protein